MTRKEIIGVLRLEVKSFQHIVGEMRYIFCHNYVASTNNRCSYNVSVSWISL